MSDILGSGGLGLGSIADLLSSLLDLIAQVFQYIWNVLAEVANFIWDNLLNLGQFTSDFASDAQKLFHHIWDVIFKATIAKLIIDYQKLHAWLQRLLGPLLRWITRLRNWYFKYIFPIIKHIQNVLSTIRVILEVFRLLGAKWAAKLDADLTKIQAYVTDFNQAILGTLNKVSTILGLIVDPGMLIRTSAFGGSLWNNLGLVKKAAGFGSARPLFPDEVQTEKQFKGAVYGSGSLTTVNADGTLVYDPALKIVDDSMTKQMQTLGIAP